MRYRDVLVALQWGQVGDRDVISDLCFASLQHQPARGRLLGDLHDDAVDVIACPTAPVAIEPFHDRFRALRSAGDEERSCSDDVLGRPLLSVVASGVRLKRRRANHEHLRHRPDEVGVRPGQRDPQGVIADGLDSGDRAQPTRRPELQRENAIEVRFRRGSVERRAVVELDPLIQLEVPHHAIRGLPGLRQPGADVGGPVGFHHVLDERFSRRSDEIEAVSDIRARVRIEGHGVRAVDKDKLSPALRRAAGTRRSAGRRGGSAGRREVGGSGERDSQCDAALDEFAAPDPLSLILANERSKSIGHVNAPPDGSVRADLKP